MMMIDLSIYDLDELNYLPDLKVAYFGDYDLGDDYDTDPVKYLSEIEGLVLNQCVYYRNDPTTIGVAPSPVPTSLPSMIMDNILLDLDTLRFTKAYTKLSDNHKIEVGEGLDNLVNSLGINRNMKPIEFDVQSGSITKEQARCVKYIKIKLESYPDGVTLKGLRYFRNTKQVILDRMSMIDIGELKYMSKLDSALFNQCDLGMIKYSSDNVYTLRKLTGIKKVIILS